MVFPPYLIKNLNYPGGLIQEQSINKILGSPGPCHMHEHNWSVKALLTASAPTSYPSPPLYTFSQAFRRKRNANLEIKSCPLTPRLPMLPLNVPISAVEYMLLISYSPFSPCPPLPQVCNRQKQEFQVSFHEKLVLPCFLLISNRAEDWGTRAATATSLEDKGFGVPVTF